MTRSARYQRWRELCQSPSSMLGWVQELRHRGTASWSAVRSVPETAQPVQQRTAVEWRLPPSAWRRMPLPARSVRLCRCQRPGPGQLQQPRGRVLRDWQDRMHRVHVHRLESALRHWDFGTAHIWPRRHLQAQARRRVRSRTCVQFTYCSGMCSACRPSSGHRLAHHHHECSHRCSRCHRCCSWC